MKQLTIAALAAGVILAGTLLEAQEERVKGADLVTKDVQEDELIPQLMALPITQQEVDLFLRTYGGVAAWAEANSEEWNSTDDAEKPIATALEFPVWDTIEATGEEFIALGVKLEMARSYANGEMTVEDIEQQLAFMRQMMAGGGEMPPEEKIKMEKMLKMMEGMLEALKNYPESNVEVYKENQEAIDKGLDALNALSAGEEDGGSG